MTISLKTGGLERCAEQNHRAGQGTINDKVRDRLARNLDLEDARLYC